MLAIDPFDPSRIASHSGERDDVTIKIWDRRWFQEPLMHVHVGSAQPRSIQWCPTREGLLCAHLALLEDPSLHMWLLRSNDAHRVSGSKGGVKMGGGGSVMSDHLMHQKMAWAGSDIADFAWHPAHEGR